MSLTSEKKLEDNKTVINNVSKILRKTLRKLENVIDNRYEIFGIAPIVFFANDELNCLKEEYMLIYNISKNYNPHKVLTDYENFRYCLLNFLDSNNYMTKNNSRELYKLDEKIRAYYIAVGALQDSFLAKLNKEYILGE